MSQLPIHRVIEDLRRAGRDPQLHGDQWQARCPAHDDNNPSLSMTTGDDGRVLLNCHAGCSLEDICNAAGWKPSDLFPQRDRPPKQIVATYDYHDEHGTLLSQIVRFEPKAFRQRRPNGRGGWIWNLRGTSRVLYRLPELISAPPDAIIFIVEGEKDADNLFARNLIATTCPQGANKWSKLSDDSVLEGRLIVIIADKDTPGRKHALDVGKRLHGRAREIRILELPGDGKDVSDWLEAGGTGEQLLAVAAAAPLFNPSPESDTATEEPAEEDEPAEKSSRTSQATRLVQLCDDVDLFHDDDIAYASVSVRDHRETLIVRSTGFRRWLGHQYFALEGGAPAAQAMADAINVLEGRALFEAQQIKVHVRLAMAGDSIFLDLNNEQRQVVEITPTGWRILDESPVRFRRPKGMLPLPLPVRGGFLSELRPLLNITDERAFVLTTAWLVGALRPGRPMPVLVFNSEQGTGKSTASRILRGLIDPNVAMIRSAPREPRDLMIASTNGWVVALDNLSFVPDWLSDALCRLSTGGGFSTRKLYENDEEQLFDALRPIILNGIEELGTRSDLLDRTIRIALGTIHKSRRIAERELMSRYEAAKPRLLGALLDAVSMGLSRINDVSLAELPRMADFALWVVACEPALPWLPGDFMRAYTENRDTAHELALEGHVIAAPIRSFAETEGTWTGTASELLEALNKAHGLGQTPQGWPKRANVLSGMLNRIAPNLREVGVGVEIPPRTREGRLITIRKVAQNIVTTVTDRHTPHPGGGNGGSCDDPPCVGDDPVTISPHTKPPGSAARVDGDDGDDRMHQPSGAGVAAVAMANGPLCREVTEL